MTSARRERWFGAASIAIICVVCGCVNPSVTRSPSPIPTVQPGYRPLSTPVAPIANAERCYAQRDAAASAEYATLLDPVAFRHLTDQAGPRSPRSCDDACDTHLADSLFTDRAITSIALVLIADPADTLNPAPSSTPDDPPGTLEFTLHGSSLVIHSTNGDVNMQYVESVIDVAPFPSGKTTTWRMVRWHDVLPLLGPGR